MGFSDNQNRALRRAIAPQNIRTRDSDGRELRYIEGAYAISEANRIFGFDAWDRETLETRCILGRENRGHYLAVYLAKVRITVTAAGARVVREGHGCGEAKGASPGEAHDRALKAAETDATKRALATFGKPFGLSLYMQAKPSGSLEKQRPARVAEATSAPPPAEPATEARGPTGAGVADAAKSVLVAPDSDKRASAIDKSVLTLGEPRRRRDAMHLRFVASQPCLLCGRTPADAHHLRFAQPQALGRKVSDEFTVPLCRGHHRQAHQSGHEAAWWADLDIDALAIAHALWDESHTVFSAAQGR